MAMFVIKIQDNPEAPGHVLIDWTGEPTQISNPPTAAQSFAIATVEYMTNLVNAVEQRRKQNQQQEVVDTVAEPAPKSKKRNRKKQKPKAG